MVPRRLGARPPAAGDHRPLRARRAADGRRGARADRRLQRLHLQPPRAARGARGRRALRFRSDSDTEVLLKGWAAWGEGMLDRLAGMFAFCLVEHASGRCVLARDRLGVKPLYLQELRDGGAAHRLLAAGAAWRRAGSTRASTRWRCTTTSPSTRSCPRRGRSCAGVREAAARDAAGDRARRPPARAPLLGPAVRARPGPRGLVGGGLGGARSWTRCGVAVRRRMVADVPVGILLSGGLDSSLIVALLAEQGQRGLATFSVGFRDVGERVGRRVRVLRPRRRASSAPTTTRSASGRSGCCRRCRARSRR